MKNKTNVFIEMLRSNSPTSARRVLAMVSILLVAYVVIKCVDIDNGLDYFKALLIFILSLLAYSTTKDIITKFQDSKTERQQDKTNTEQEENKN